VTRTVLGYLFTIEWAVYVGGALFMELVWRPLQRHVPPGQTGAMCLAMGRRYRWLALACLALIAGTALAWSAVGGELAPGAGRRSTVPWSTVALGAAWVVLVGLVATMGLLVHPRSHARSHRGQDEGEVRRRRLRAIRLMDVLLRVELAVALMGALVAVWPVPSGPGKAL
jgi:uncharacterized membrane protein